MKSTEKKARFIELRASGASYDTIATELSISKSTCTQWARKFDSEILARESERMTELFTLYGMEKAARIERLGETLKKIQAALNEADFSKLPADKLLDCFLKCEKQLADLYIVPIKPITEHSLDEILLQYISTLAKAQSGEITAETAKAELTAIERIHNIMAQIEERDNPFALVREFPVNE